MTDQYVAEKFPTKNTRFAGRQNPRLSEARAHYIYLIKRSDGAVKVGVSKNVRARRSSLANASPEELSILKVAKPGKGLAFHIETAVKCLPRPFHMRGEWFRCSEALAMLALRAAERGAVEDRACIAMEVERQRLVKDAADWVPHCTEMLKRFPDFLREVDEWGASLVQENTEVEAEQGRRPP
jgi:predicted GIY-YIG superfamily endonuclease